MFRRFLILIFVFAFSAVSFAQDTEVKRTRKKSRKKSGEKRVQGVNFEDELITGDINKPELLYLLKQRQASYKKLIKFRKDFLPEMRKTTENLRHSRGNK